MAVDRVDQDQAAFGRGVLAGVEEDPPGGAAAQAAPTELGRGVADGEADLTGSGDEASGLWRELADAVRALKSAYSPDGLNVGANLGRSAGAGVPGHFHMHCVPRWNGDTNFMTTLAETRMLPESLPATYEKVSKAWPSDG